MMSLEFHEPDCACKWCELEREPLAMLAHPPAGAFDWDCIEEDDGDWEAG